jgi:hydroxyacylglutathione hydrolase
MRIKQMVCGPIATNCYLVACEETLESFVVDPDMRKKGEEDEILSEISRRGLKVRYIINTHYHSDHIGGNGFLKKKTQAKILIHQYDADLIIEPWRYLEEMITKHNEPPCPFCGNERATLDVMEEKKTAVLGCPGCRFKMEMKASPPADEILRDGDTREVGTLKLKVIHTPGHSRGGMCIYLEDEHVLFSGDTLFRQSVGRTDLLDGSLDDIIESVTKLGKLPEETKVYPGHGESTTIGIEKRGNPFLQKKKEDA